MKKANQPTDCVLIKAETESEWDNCKFAIILSDHWRTLIRHRLQALQAFNADSSFYRTAYWDSTAVYFVSPASDDDEPVVEEIIGSDTAWAFVELEEGEQEKFSVPENRLDAHQLCLMTNGIAMFKAYGKHTSEEFFTAEFDIKSIVGDEHF